MPWYLAGALLGLVSWDEVRARMAWLSPSPSPVRPRILVHAVSAGEVAAAEPLLGHLAGMLPGWDLLVSVGSRTGLSAATGVAERVPRVCLLGLMPWDRARAVRRWLQSAAPEGVVVIETELWPNLFRECKRARARLALVNARIYPEDLWRYRLIGGFMRGVLAFPDLIGVQHEAERERFLALGADPQRLFVGGNTKVDAAVATLAPGSNPALAAQDQLLLVAGSTHWPEERYLVEALVSLRGEWPGLRLVVAPRAVQRASRVARYAGERGVRAVRGSGAGDAGDWDVLVIDRIGLLREWYGRADVVFVGGSLAAHGGHNFLEPAAYARPVVVGPHMTHFQELLERFRTEGALLQLGGVEELEGVLRRLFRDAALRAATGRRATRCLREGQGAARAYAQRLVSLLDPKSRGAKP